MSQVRFGKEGVLPMYTPCILSFVGSDNWKEVIALQKLTCSLVTVHEVSAPWWKASGYVREKVRATSDMVMNKTFSGFLLTKIFNRISPQNIAHQSLGRGLAKSVNLDGCIYQNYWKRVCCLKQIHTTRMSSRVLSSGDNPPCMHKNCLFMIAASGKAQNDSMHASYMRSEYLCLPKKVKHG